MLNKRPFSRGLIGKKFLADTPSERLLEPVFFRFLERYGGITTARTATERCANGGIWVKWFRLTAQQAPNELAQFRK